MYSRRRRIRIFNPILDTLEPITYFKPPEWLPLSGYLTRRWERRNRWPPYRGMLEFICDILPFWLCDSFNFNATRGILILLIKDARSFSMWSVIKWFELENPWKLPLLTIFAFTSYWICLTFETSLHAAFKRRSQVLQSTKHLQLEAVAGDSHLLLKQSEHNNEVASYIIIHSSYNSSEQRS